MVSSLSHNTESQTHSRVSECDGRPPVQVQPSAVKKMVTASTGVQTNLPVPDPKAWDIDALNLNWTGLTAYAYPPMALLHRVIQKIRHCHCLIIVIAPGWPGMPWFWDLVQLSTEIPLQLPVSTTLLKQSHKYVSQQPSTPPPPRLVSRSGQLQEQGFSVEVAERIPAPQRSSTRTIYRSKWALFEK